MGKGANREARRKKCNVKSLLAIVDTLLFLPKIYDLRDIWTKTKRRSFLVDLREGGILPPQENLYKWRLVKNGATSLEKEITLGVCSFQSVLSLLVGVRQVYWDRIYPFWKIKRLQ